MAKKLTRGVRNNNPFNIRYSANNNWQGKIFPPFKKDNQFEEFLSVNYGLRAGVKLLMRYWRIYKLCSVHSIIRRFAPDNENNTSQYINYIVSKLGFDYFTTDDQFLKLCCEIAFYESKYKVLPNKLRLYL